MAVRGPVVTLSKESFDYLEGRSKALTALDGLLEQLQGDATNLAVQAQRVRQGIALARKVTQPGSKAA